MFESLTTVTKYVTSSSTNRELEDKLLLGAWVYLGLTSVITYLWPAPYGKFQHSATKVKLLQHLTQLQISAPLAWMVQEVPSLLLSLMAQVFFYQADLYKKMILLSPFLLHYFNRSVVFPIQLKNGQPVPLFTVKAATMFTAFNGFLQSLSLLNSLDSSSTLIEVAGLTFFCPSLVEIVGLSLFCLGMVANIHSDHLLRGLRGQGETGYKIPMGGLFTFVSSPNYLGESLEWWGFAILVQTKAAVWFACFTSVFLGQRALQTHQWYKEKFRGEYPGGRKAFLPGII